VALKSRIQRLEKSKKALRLAYVWMAPGLPSLTEDERRAAMAAQDANDLIEVRWMESQK
jgi:propanediol dehydratase large subunit